MSDCESEIEVVSESLEDAEHDVVTEKVEGEDQENINPNRRTSTLKTTSTTTKDKRKRNFSFMKSWEAKYGTRITARNADTLSPVAVICRFCQSFGREVEDESSRKRKKTKLVQEWRGKFRSDKIKSHLELNHHSKWEEYQRLTTDLERNNFFKTLNIFTRRPNRNMKAEKVLVKIRNSLCGDFIFEHFLFEPQDSEESKENQKARLIDTENLIDVGPTNRYETIVRLVSRALSFSQVSFVFETIQEIGPGAALGRCARPLVTRAVRQQVLVSLEAVARLLESCWHFSLAFDGGNNFEEHYLDVRIRTSKEGKLHNLHLVAVPMNKRHTGEYMCELISKVLDCLLPDWKQKLFGISSDGASSMTGCHQGAVTRLQREAEAALPGSRIIRTWCGLHQMDIRVKEALNLIEDKSFVDSLTQLSAHLRKQQQFVREFGLCPSYAKTRWISILGVVNWMIQHKKQIKDHLLDKDPGPKIEPSEQFWVYLYVVQAVMDPIELTFKKLQGKETLIQDQEAAFGDLVEDLTSLGNLSVGSAAEVAGTYRRGQFSIDLETSLDFVFSLPSSVLESFENLSEEKQNNIQHEVAQFLVHMVAGINNVVVERDSSNQGIDTLIPTLPLDLMNVSHQHFNGFVQEWKLKLSHSFGDSMADLVQLQFRSLKMIKTRDKQKFNDLLKCQGSGFSRSWNILGASYSKLCEFVGAVASVFPNTSTVESDFSLIKHERSKSRKMLSNLSLEGILHCKQYKEINQVLDW